jgi:hypothetical protein
MLAASGDVSDYSSSVLASIRSAVATAAGNGVFPADVLIDVRVGSVVLDVSILVMQQAAASSITSNIATNIASPTSASAMLASVMVGGSPMSVIVVSPPSNRCMNCFNNDAAGLAGGGNGGGDGWVSILSGTIVVLLLLVVGQSLYWRLKRKGFRPTLGRKRFGVLDLTDGSARASSRFNDRGFSNSVEMGSAPNSPVSWPGSPSLASPDTSQKGFDGRPMPPPPSAFVDNVEGFVDIGSAKTNESGVGGTRNAAAKARAQASNRAAGRGTPGDKKDVAPVVVTVPLSHALDKPIIANLDANHQIESIRSEGSWVPKGDHI